MVQPTNDSFDGLRGRVETTTWAAAEPRFVVLLAHGYAEHAGRYAHVAERLVREGAVVVAPDHAGHGRSEGEQALVQDIEDLVTDVQTLEAQLRERHPDLPFVLLGHSMGGLIATRAVQRGTTPDALVLSGPFVGDNAQLRGLLDLPELPEIPLDPAALSRDPAVGEAYVADELVYSGPFKRPTVETMFATVDRVAEGPDFGAVPTLWVHGEEDPLSLLDTVGPVVRRLKAEGLVEKVYPGARHEVFNETNKDEVLDDVASFLRDVLAPAPA